ncbi:hypothetical protein [Pantoea agglomerans]|uniref:hypothetical protein n=1 Tax=Enterobacter agglomerans TaxID=549 RepID=UPI002413A80C|nr:hypothetical protein [Pantoea agglomerans]
MNLKRKPRSGGEVLLIVLGLFALVICVPMAFWWGALSLWNWFVVSAGWHATIAVNWATVIGAWLICWFLKLLLTQKSS